MVDIQYPCPMPSAIPPAHYRQNSYLAPLLSAEGPVLRDRKVSLAGRQQHNDTKHSIRSADISHGLRTPPKDMSGVGVNPLLAPNFEGSQYKSVPSAVRDGPPRQGSLGSLVNTRPTDRAQTVQNTYHNRSRSHEHTTTQSNGPKESNTRPRSEVEDSSIVSYLQIPSSINGSKGSLAEFAAQVCHIQSKSSATEIDFSRLPACSGLSPPSHSSTSKSPRRHQHPSNRSSPKLYRQWGFENGLSRFCAPLRCHRMSYSWP